MVLVSQFVRTWDWATAPCQVFSGSPDLSRACALPRPTPGQGHGRRGKDDDRCPAARWWFQPCFVRQNQQQQKKLFFDGDFRPLPNKNVQMLDHFFPLLFPKDSESLKIFDIRLLEVGAKRPLNGTSKVNRQTNRQTDKRTFRLIESIGPEGRCFENLLMFGKYCITRKLQIRLCCNNWLFYHWTWKYIYRKWVKKRLFIEIGLANYLYFINVC